MAAVPAPFIARPWMTEFWTLVLGLPILIAFIPHGGAELVLRGFTAIKAAPDWFKWAVGAACAVSYGLRGTTTVFALRQSAQASSTSSLSPPAQGAGITGATK